MTNWAVMEELRTIQKANGLLKAEDVVSAARAVTSPLHHHFTWEDSEAAHLYRLIEARCLIRCAVEYRQIEAKTVEMRAFLSLPEDRLLPGGGYRSMIEVLEKPTLRDQRLADLIAELQRIQCRCSEFQELRRVYAAIDEVAGKKFPPRGARPPRRSAEPPGAQI